MRLNWKLLRLAILAALAVSLAGCGGINAGGSVSPATFLLPGAMNTPAPKAGTPMIAATTSQQLTQVR